MANKKVKKNKVVKAKIKKITPLKKTKKPEVKSVVKKMVSKKLAEKKVKKVAPKISKKAPEKKVKKVPEKKIKKIFAKKPEKKIEKNLEKKPEKKSQKTLLQKITQAKAKGVKEKAIAAKAMIAEKKNEKKLDKKNISNYRPPAIKASDSRNKATFKIGDYAIYPSHGVGKIAGIEKTSILGQEMSCYLMYFEKEKLTIKIPFISSAQIGLRHPISKAQMDEVFIILRSGIKKLKGMWSRRAQEYETKINSGDIMLLAEVLRDLTRDIEDSERSYSERIIYETAIYRLASEYSIIYGVSFEEAKDKIINTAKDKLNSEGKITQRDDFDDEFDADEESEENEDEESEDEEDEDEEGDEDDDFDDDDDKPKRKKKK